MSLESAEIIAFLIQSYVAAGLAFALVFVSFGAARVDQHLTGSPVAVRMLIFPGAVIFWPLLARRWARR